MLVLVLMILRPPGYGRAGTAPQPAPLPHFAKGYELYSWTQKGVWCFTLITGTNRQKTHDEITTGQNVLDRKYGWVKLTLRGVPALKAALARLPRGEWLFWHQGWIQKAPPPRDLVETISKVCQADKIQLEILKP